MLTISIATLIYFAFFKYRYIKIVKATAKKFTKRSHNDEHTINYRIEFIVKKSSEDMKIDELWIDRKLYKFKITREASFDQVGEFDKKEKLKIDAYEVAEDHLSSTLIPPGKFNGDAIIGYWISNKKKYLAVNKIEMVY